MAAAGREIQQELDEATFVAIRRIVFEQSGISLKGDKRTLVAARLGKRMRRLGIPTYRAYLQRLRDCRTGAELTFLLDAISTNVTSFFREADHFDLLRCAYGEWRGKGQTRFRIWCAASSSGEEPYSMGITLHDVGVRGCDVKILGTDISTEILRKAMRARYAKKSIEPVPVLLRDRYFKRLAPDEYEVTPAVRDMVVFRQTNLSKLPTPLKGPLDVIFCRNVMIYFEDALRRRLVEEFERLLKPEGYLVVGHSESLVGMQGGLKMVRPSVYRKGGA
ncbi:MAG: protein-glutamate O-methyltransferase CheR [Myxococcales bacterium]|nr:protein-glutamate O-methyltransferase CheR [Myxococcales bacterium]